MATQKSTTKPTSQAANKSYAAKLLRAERRIDLMLHFEAAFERILKDPECAHCSTAEVAAKLAQETVSWIEGYDKMLSPNKAA
jgi:hypothetical protein